MSKTLLLVDGSNLVMRAAFGGDVEPVRSAQIATGLIRRACHFAGATHLIVALDSPVPSWRKLEYPDYKADRTRDTTPWLQAAHDEWVRAGWYVADHNGFEADDIIATLGQRAAAHCRVVVCSSDSDLQVLTDQGIEFLRPLDGGKFAFLTPADVCAKYALPRAGLLPEFKALMGESGDNVPGVPGIGKQRAAALLTTYGNLEAILLAGREAKCKQSALVHTHEAIVRRALRLVTLTTNVPLHPIAPNHCLLHENHH